MTRNIPEAERESIRRDAIRECIDAIDAEASLYVNEDLRRVMNLAVETVRKLYDRRAAAEPEAEEFPCRGCGVMLKPWPNWLASQMKSTAARCPECGHPCDGGAP